MHRVCRQRSPTLLNTADARFWCTAHTTSEHSSKTIRCSSNFACPAMQLLVRDNTFVVTIILLTKQHFSFQSHIKQNERRTRYHAIIMCPRAKQSKSLSSTSNLTVTRFSAYVCRSSTQSKLEAVAVRRNAGGTTGRDITMACPISPYGGL